MENNLSYPLTNASKFLHLKPRSPSMCRSESASLRLDTGSILSVTDSEITTQTDSYSRRTSKAESSYAVEDITNSIGNPLAGELVTKFMGLTGFGKISDTSTSREAARDDYEDNFGHIPQSGRPTIPDANGDGYASGARGGATGRSWSSLLPSLSEDATTQAMVVHPQGAVDYNAQSLPPWQRIHGRLLSWANVWPTSELENALDSTTQGQQVDETALTIWSTQTYKRYVRAKLAHSPRGVVDRLFVPPNIAEEINNAVFNGRYGDACRMLKDSWVPFGLEGIPRILTVLSKHRSDPNHWVVHRFSLPDGDLTTYDSYPERSLPDSRALGWWFAIRIAWPCTMHLDPKALIQKVVRFHRPMQVSTDNSLAAAGIWRNILMGSRAERSLDFQRLRDLINTEVKNLKQRKLLDKLSKY